MDSQGTARKTALVTGASSGIGRELARLLAADRIDLVLVSRDAAALEALARQLGAEYGVEARAVARDLSEAHAASALWADLGGRAIDILVNNAGVGLYGPVHEQDPDALERMVQLNVVALTSLTRLALPAMIERRWGRVLNVGSLVGYQPEGPRMAGYYASKAFVVSFSGSLARELAGTGVSVTALSPGPTETSFERNSGANRSNLFRFVPTMTAEAVAAAGYRGMKRQSAVVIPGFVAKALAIGGRLPPRFVAAALNRFLLQEARR